MTKISYLKNIFEKVTLRNKKCLNNKIVESRLKKKENTSKKTTTQNQKRKYYLPHVFYILLLLKNLFASVFFVSH